MIDIKNKINKNINYYKLNTKKKKLIKVLNNSKHLNNKWLINELIRNGEIDEHIQNLNNEIILTNVSSFIKEGYLSSEEHFLCVIDHFINYFLDRFNNIELLKNVLSLSIASDIGNILMSKKYLFNNKNLKYYIYNYNLMIINNFYYNALDFKEELEELFNDINLDIDNINIKNEEQVNNLVDLLAELCLVNRDRHIILTFFTKPEEEKRKYYIDCWELLIYNYQKNMNFIIEYRKQKTNYLCS